MVCEPMDHDYLRIRGIDFDDPKFVEEYRRFRKIYVRKGVMPEAILMLLVERQVVRVEKGKAMRAGKQKVEA